MQPVRRRSRFRCAVLSNRLWRWRRREIPEFSKCSPSCCIALARSCCIALARSVANFVRQHHELSRPSQAEHQAALLLGLAALGVVASIAAGVAAMLGRMADDRADKMRTVVDMGKAVAQDLARQVTAKEPGRSRQRLDSAPGSMPCGSITGTVTSPDRMMRFGQRADANHPMPNVKPLTDAIKRRVHSRGLVGESLHHERTGRRRLRSDCVHLLDSW